MMGIARPSRHRLHGHAFTPLQGDGTIIARARAGLQGCISDVLVYKESDRRKGIASALYRLIEAELTFARNASIRLRMPGFAGADDGSSFWTSMCMFMAAPSQQWTCQNLARNV
jgi:hypothetical protein